MPVSASRRREILEEVARVRPCALCGGPVTGVPSSVEPAHNLCLARARHNQPIQRLGDVDCIACHGGALLWTAQGAYRHCDACNGLGTIRVEVD